MGMYPCKYKCLLRKERVKMILTNKQEVGLKEIISRYKMKEKYTTIAGYAGTGKSTLVKFAIAALNVDLDRVAYATYTGKAAEVLRKKGNPGACTLHKLLYDHRPLPNGGFFRVAKTELNVDIVVVDEVSMVPKSMIDVLLRHHIYIIFLGDPFQLPQIEKKEENGLLDKPHVFLDEIMRQAAESEIIQLTMKIRHGEQIPIGQGKEVIVLPREQLTTGCLTWADQVIVATNGARQSINNQIRELLGYSGLPQDGERMICLRNYWDDFSISGNPLVNGTTGVIQNTFESFVVIPRYVHASQHEIPLIQCDFLPDDDNYPSITMDKQMIVTGEKCVDYKTAYQLGKLKDRIGDILPKEFAFGYAITCHKAQGSEYDKVLVIEEKFPFAKNEHARWLYTACTRSTQKLVLVRS